MMNGLTKEQIQKIEENKRIALQKRQQHLSSGASYSTGSSKSILNANLKNGCSFDKLKPDDIEKNSEKLPARNPFAKSGIKDYLKPGTTKAASSVEYSATCKLISGDRFGVEMGFHEKSIDIMKTINGRTYDNTLKMWTFPISEHDTLISKLSILKPNVIVSGLPKNIVSCFKVPSIDYSSVKLDTIDPALLSILLPFQIDGIKFGISRKGRCLIADDMGLGKTIQALGIAHYFMKDWPLLIVCPSSMRFPWEEAFHKFLPSVSPFSIIVMTTGHDDIQEFNVVIVSYDLLKSSLDVINRKKFGTLIFDESHFLKSRKSARTKAAFELTPRASHVILLSGTPALSRPQELYPQIQAIDTSTFLNFSEFGLRYCAGKQTRFGWDFSGSSNSTELELLLKRKFMLRRLKSEVLGQLPAKLRKVVILHPKMVKAVSKQMAAFTNEMESKKGVEKRGALLQFYCATGTAKLEAVKEYLEDKLENPGKMLVFAHHAHVLNGLEDLMISKKVDYIRIDGATTAEARATLCDEFQTEPNTRVALLSIKAANAGLTLTAAQLVVFAELYWNPGELTQAEDRAHRIGQQDSVNVEYLVAKGTADDHLWKMVEDKLRVLNSVGLSKDSFKASDTEHIHQKNQPAITEFLEKKPADEIACDLGFSASQVTDLFSKDFDSLQEAFVEDDVFDSLDLTNIENEYVSERKKAKLS